MSSIRWLEITSAAFAALALCVGALSLAAVVHPLMAAYALGCVLLLSCLVVRSPQIRNRRNDGPRSPCDFDGGSAVLLVACG